MTVDIGVVSGDGSWCASELEEFGAQRCSVDEVLDRIAADALDLVVIGPDVRPGLLLRRLRLASALVSAVVAPATEPDRRELLRAPGIPTETRVLRVGAPPHEVAEAVADGVERVRLRRALRSTLDQVRGESERPMSETGGRSRSLDHLTGLLDRASILEALGARRSFHDSAVLFVDVDRFKSVNDQHGHHVGDHVLRSVAERLRRAVRPGDLVGRLGGDEFVIVVELSPGGRSAEQIADRIVTSFDEPIRMGSWEIPITVSVGVAADPGSNAAVNLANADAAMYRSKQGGRARYLVHDEIAERERRRRQHLVESLPEALRAGQIRSLLQPVFDVLRRGIVGYRAEPVWVDKVEGAVRLHELRGIADRAGLAEEVEVAFWRNALQAFRLREGTTPSMTSRLAFPVRSLVLEERVFGELRREVERSLLEPEQITIEVPADAVELLMACAQLTASGLVLGVSDAGATPLDLATMAAANVRSAALAPGLLHHEVGQRVLFATTAGLRALHIHCVGTGVQDPHDMLVLREAAVLHCCGPLLSEAADEAPSEAM